MPSNKYDPVIIRFADQNDIEKIREIEERKFVQELKQFGEYTSNAIVSDTEIWAVAQREHDGEIVATTSLKLPGHQRFGFEDVLAADKFDRGVTAEQGGLYLLPAYRKTNLNRVLGGVLGAVAYDTGAKHTVYIANSRSIKGVVGTPATEILANVRRGNDDCVVFKSNQEPYVRSCRGELASYLRGNYPHVATKLQRGAVEIQVQCPVPFTVDKRMLDVLTALKPLPDADPKLDPVKIRFATPRDVAKIRSIEEKKFDELGQYDHRYVSTANVSSTELWLIAERESDGQIVATTSIKLPGHDRFLFENYINLPSAERFQVAEQGGLYLSPAYRKTNLDRVLQASLASICYGTGAKATYYMANARSIKRATRTPGTDVLGEVKLGKITYTIFKSEQDAYTRASRGCLASYFKSKYSNLAERMQVGAYRVDEYCPVDFTLDSEVSDTLEKLPPPPPKSNL